MWNFPPQNIVVGVDFGPASARAVRAAALLAERFRSRVTVVHAEVFEPPPYFTHQQLSALEEQRQAMRRQATAYLRAFVDQEGLAEARLLIEDGAPADVLLRTQTEADLMIVGTHGRRGPSRWWLGSVAERLMRACTIPVLVTHETPIDSDTFQHVLLVTAAPPDGNHSSAVARQLASAFDGDVTFAATVDPAEMANSPVTTVVVGRSSSKTTDGNSALTESLVRACKRPLLCVPED